MRFYEWCALDPSDTITIRYRFRQRNGKVKRFTSENEVPYSMVARLRDALVESIELKTDALGDNYWEAVLYEE